MRLVLLLVLGVAACDSPLANGDGGGAPDDGGSGDGGDAAVSMPLSISPNPASATVTITNGVVTTTPITFTASYGAGPVVASWQIDRGELGTLGGGDGVFTANGHNAGVAHVTATVGGDQATAVLTVTVASKNLGSNANSGTGPQTPDDAGAPPPGGFNGVGGVPLGGAPPPATVTLLDGGSGANAAFTMLYPYDGTIWPRGMLPPLLQWSVPAGYHANAVWIHLKQQNFDFQGYYAGSDLVNAPVDATAWTLATNSNAGDALTIEVKISDGATVLGPLSLTSTIAGSRLRGTVYYNTYNSKLNPGMQNGSDGNGAVLSIDPGGFQPQLAVPSLKGTCHVCHEVSSDGSTLFTATSIAQDIGSVFDLKTGNNIGNYDTGTFTYSGAYPDGTMALLGSREDYHAWPNDSDLYSRNPVASKTSSGFKTAVTRAVTPSFSPDGRHVAFNFWEGSGANGVTAGNGVSLAAMDFDCGAPMASTTCGGSSPYTFNALRELFRAPAGHYVGWPSFTPDSKMLLFQNTVTACGDGGSVLNTRSPAQAELWITDLPDAATGTTRFSPMALCAANGLKSDCTTSYLPTNANNHMDDQQLNFEPNVTPIAAGGYYWVIFTSRRLYGNVATTEPYFPYQSGAAATTPPTKKLWVAAIDPNPKPGQDPSHPAFYLPGQEIMSGNMRAFWVNQPCQTNGVSCETGDECCSGYCVDNGAGMLTCGDKPAGCVPEFGKCTKQSDCCGALDCIGNVCSQPAIP